MAGRPGEIRGRGCLRVSPDGADQSPVQASKRRRSDRFRIGQRPSGSQGGRGEPWPREGSADVEFLGEKGSSLFPRTPAVRKARMTVTLPREGAGERLGRGGDGGRPDRLEGAGRAVGEIDLAGSAAVEDIGPWFAGLATRPAAGAAWAEMKLDGRIDRPSLEMTISRAGPLRLRPRVVPGRAGQVGGRKAHARRRDGPDALTPAGSQRRTIRSQGVDPGNREAGPFRSPVDRGPGGSPERHGHVPPGSADRIDGGRIVPPDRDGRGSFGAGGRFDPDRERRTANRSARRKSPSPCRIRRSVLTGQPRG